MPKPPEFQPKTQGINIDDPTSAPAIGTLLNDTFQQRFDGDNNYGGSTAVTYKGDPEKPDEWEAKYNRMLRVVSLGTSLLAIAVVVTLEIIYLFHVDVDVWTGLIREHFSAIVGLKAAVIVSFVIVVFLRQVEGPIEFEAVGMKFRGAAGQVILWAFCVMVLSLCAKLLW